MSVRTLGFLVGVAGVFTLVIGALHLPAGQRLLGMVAGCPFPMGAATWSAEQREEARRVAVAPLAGVDPVDVATTSIGLVLGEATTRDFVAFSEARGGACGPAADDVGVRCAGVELDGRSVVLSAGFDPGDRLVSFSRSQELHDAPGALRVWQGAIDALAGQYGEPDRVVGVGTARWLQGGPLRQGRQEWHRSNAHALVSVTTMGPDRWVVREVDQVVRAYGSATAQVR